MNDLTDMGRGRDSTGDFEFHRREQRRKAGSTGPSDPESGVVPQLTNDLWQRLEFSEPSADRLLGQKIVAGRSSVRAARPIAMLRTQILQTMKTHDFDAFAVTGPLPRCGASFLAMNLAFSMARQESLRVVLLDLNLAAPSLARRLGVSTDIENFSESGGNLDLIEKVVRLGDNLALGFNAHRVAASSERLQDMANGGIINQVRQELRPDVIICDTPPVLSSDDLVALAPQLGGVLVVADGQRTRPEHIKATETLLEDRARLIGVVLNRAAGA